MPDFKIPKVSLGNLGVVFGILLIITLVVAGTLGILISYTNPTVWIEPYVPTELGPTLVYVNSIVVSLNENWIATLSVSIGLLLMALIQPEVRRGIRSFPRQVLSAYRRVRSWRDWLFAKIEYLNGESAKWKRTFNILKSPYSLLRALGLNPQMAIGLLAVGSTAGTGVIVNETVLAERSFSNGDSGVYLAPSDIPSTFDDKDNTLAINLGAVPVREIKLENISTGEIYKGGAGNNDVSVIPSTCDATDPAKAGNAKCPAVLVSGHPAVAASGDTPAFVATRIKIGTLIIEKSRCRTLTFSDIDAHSILIDSNFADGISIHSTAGTAPNRSASMGGHHTAASMSSSGGTYDRLVVSPTTSAVDGYIGTLVLSNVYSKGGGGCVFKSLDIGELKIIQNEVGHDSSLLTKEFQVLNSVLGATWVVTNNVELILPEPAIENANP